MSVLTSRSSFFWFHRLDYVVIITLFLLTAILAKDAAGLTFKRFYVTEYVDPSIAYPLVTEETFPDITVVLIVGAIFTFAGLRTFYAFSIMSENFGETKLFRNNWDVLRAYKAHTLGLMYLQTVSLSGFVGQCCKLYAGRLRPNFLARLATEDPHMIADGHFSYISGHATFSFASMLLLGLFFLGQKKTLTPKSSGHSTGFAEVIVLLFTPLMFAAMVAISRTRDYYHDFSDINAGAAVGCFCAVCTYFLNFPSLVDEDCDIPCVALVELKKEVALSKVEKNLD